MIASVSTAARDSFFCSRLLAGEQPGQIAGGAERPFARDPHEIDAAAGVEALQFGHHRGDLGARRQPGGDRRLVERFGGGEDQGLGDAQRLGIAGRRRRRRRRIRPAEQFGDFSHHALFHPVSLIPSSGRARTQIGAKARSWRNSSFPSRTNSSEAEKEEARAVRRWAGSTQ